MTHIIEREGDRIYINRTPPCGHNNGTHPSGCWYVAVCDAVAAERARIREALDHRNYPTHSHTEGGGTEFIALRDVLAIIEGREP